MLQLKTPNNIPVNVPENDLEDPSIKFNLANIDSAIDYYNEYGYVIFQDIINQTLCDQASAIWNEHVVPTKRYMYRQATGKIEKNIIDKNNWVMNPILNLQSLDPKYFSELREFSVNSILTNKNLKTNLEAILNGKIKIVQSMFFQGNSETWEHQDTYYLDSEFLGSMTAAWIALEDIKADAGRFFIVPSSHKITMEQQNKETNIVDFHDVYIKNVLDEVRKSNLEVRAPNLNKGDVLFWNSRTIHGSLKQSNKSSKSRLSITCHAINNDHKFLQLQSIQHDLKCDEINGVMIWRPKDLSKAMNRAIFFIESKFPTLFYLLKNIAVRYYVSNGSN